MILMALVSNWDNHDSNNRIFEVRGGDGGLEQRYIVADWGSSFGRVGRPGYFTRRSRWDLKDYQEQAFIDGVRGTELLLHYNATEPIKPVPLDHARWFSRLASQLTAKQVRRAFEAAGATPQEGDGFTARLLERIGELRDATAIERRPISFNALPAFPTVQ